ncbi:hypothetical protein [Nonomuraea sp. NPDC049158]|uniref:hypothetical protein n=1 Tax=Nonomuraea sp. NPDC049158 TaxID=3155649 RepID=UPI0033D98E9B
MTRRDIERSELHISDAEMDQLRDRARKANPHLDSLTHPEAIKQRLAARDQSKKARWS